jgi:hypothetical protein
VARKTPYALPLDVLGQRTDDHLPIAAIERADARPDPVEVARPRHGSSLGKCNPARPMNHGAHKNTVPRRLVAGALAAAALSLGACGGGDDGSDDASSATARVSEVSACFDDLGQHPRKVEVSLVKVPPDLGVSSSRSSIRPRP